MNIAFVILIIFAIICLVGKEQTMSIILKGIDMPNSGQIELIIRPHGKVLSKTRGISARAIQIPKGHGRLIDADAVEDELDERCGQLSAEIVRNAPTILEAEDPKPSDIRPITGKLKYTLDVENGILTRGIEPEDE